MTPEAAYTVAQERIASLARHTLDLRDLGLTSLPPEIWNLTALTYLDLDGNSLTALPPEIGNLTALAFLRLDGNSLTTLPPEIGNLTALTLLDLDSNGLTALPPEIGNLTALTLLRLDGNSLTTLPQEFGNLTALTHLVLHGNSLTALPPEIGNLTALTDLSLHGNSLTALPPEFGNLAALTLLLLEENPLPREILALESNPSALRAFLREQAVSVARPLREVKLVFLGPPDIGKSCLLRHLQGKPFQKTPSTVGFDVTIESLPLGEGERAIQASCWDFGGQPKYEITHQFFFSKENIFVVAWKPRDGATKLRQWLEIVRQRAGADAPVLVVATHRDEPAHTPEAVDPERFKREFPGIADFFWVTNLDPATTEEVKAGPLGGVLGRAKTVTTGGVPDGHEHPEAAAQAIEDSVVEFARMRRLIFDLAETRIVRDFPEGRRLARSKIRSLKGPAATVSVCRALGAEHMDAERVDDLLMQMDALGDIVFHPGEREDNLVILQPQWLGKSIGFALDDPLFTPGDGEVDHATLVAIWKKFAAAEGYRAEHYPYFLWLMERFDLAYRMNASRSLVPQMVRGERPRELPFVPTDNYAGGKQCAYQWTARDMNAPRGLVPQLTTALSDRRGPSQEQCNWKGGFFLTMSEGQRVFVELTDRKLMLAVRSESPNWAASKLAYAITQKIASVWPGAQIDLEYPCKNCLIEGRYPVHGFRVSQVDAREDDFPFLCPNCDQESKAAELKRGYAINDEIREVLSRLKDLEQASAEGAKILQSLLVASSTHPNRIVLREAEGKWSDVGYEMYALHVYCDHPEHLEPVANYRVPVPKAWLKTVKTIAHWTGVIAEPLKLVVPGIKALDEVFEMKTPVETMELAIKGLELFGKDLDIGDFETRAGMDENDATRRVMQALLDSVAKNKGYGGLNRQEEHGRVRWLCEDHRDKPPTM
jgi:internalin A